jgi:anti-anti-sigma factor
VDDLRRDLDEMLAAGDTRIALDMTEVPMIDSSGIGLLVRYLTAAKQAGGTLKLIKPSDFAIKTLKMTGVLNLFEVFPDEELAVDSFE